MEPQIKADVGAGGNEQQQQEPGNAAEQVIRGVENNEEDEDDVGTKRKQPGVLCEECGKADAKYKCPRCLRRTCSLPCVKLHKEKDNCSGKRNKAEYHSLLDFTDEHLHSDFHYLQDVERVADSAHRQAFRSKLYLRTNLPNHLKNLVRQARFRGVNLVIMPATFQRRRENSTMFSHRDKEMLWRVEFVFHMDARKSFFEDKVSEKALLAELLAKYTDASLGSTNAKERQQVPETAKTGLQQCRLLIRQEPSKADDVRYYAVQSSDSLAAALMHKTIIESPIIHIFSEAEAKTLQVVPTPDFVPNSAPKELASAAGAEESAAAALPYVRRPREEGDGGRGRGRGSWRGRGRGRGGAHRGGRGGHAQGREAGQDGDAEEKEVEEEEEEGLEPEAVGEEEVAAIMELVDQDLSKLGVLQS